MTFDDGTIYEGNFNKGEFKGKGKMTWNNGYEYNGEFNGSILSGKGKLSGPNGDIYEIIYRHNFLHQLNHFLFYFLNHLNYLLFGLIKIYFLFHN